MSDTITVEGIEDIDLKTATDKTAIQCKYHEGTEYNHSEIKTAIQWMVKHFAEVKEGKKERVNYLYYGHFKSGHEKFPEDITLDFLKKDLLTFRKDGVLNELFNDLSLSDENLKDFIEAIEINIHAQNYDELYGEIIDSFISHSEIDCDNHEDAKGFFCNNAFSAISDIAIESDIAKRTISKELFIEKINTKKLFFNRWYAHFLGRKIYIKYIKDQYFKSHNRSPYMRFFLIDADNSSINSIKHLILCVIKKYTKILDIGRKSFCPYVYLHNVNEDKLKNIKRQLRDELGEDVFGNKYRLVDGYDYCNADFCLESLIQKVTNRNIIKIKFINDLGMLSDIYDRLKDQTKEVYQFHISDNFYNTDRQDIKFVSVQVDNLAEIEGII